MKSSGEYSNRKLVPYYIHRKQALISSSSNGRRKREGREKEGKETYLRTVLLSESPADLGVISGELEGLLLGVPEDDGSEERRGSVVEMHDDVLSSSDGGERPLDEILSSRGEDLRETK